MSRILLAGALAAVLLVTPVQAGAQAVPTPDDPASPTTSTPPGDPVTQATAPDDGHDHDEDTGAAPRPDLPVAVDLAARGGTSDVTLSWALPPSAEGAVVDGWVVRRDGHPVAQVAGAARSYTDPNLLAEETYSYTVAAVADGAEGRQSEAVEASPTGDTSFGAPAVATRARQTERRVYTYSIARRGSVRTSMDRFALHVAQTLNDPRSWSLGGRIEFRQVARGGNFTVWLSTAGNVPSFASYCSSSWSCRVGRNVIINETRWRGATPSWRGSGGSIDSYQHYVVIHEVGHWMGFGHSGCPGPGRPAPTMMQQSKGLNGCKHNGWPTGGERASAGSRHGTGVANAGRAVLQFRWGQGNEQVLACDWDGDGRDTPTRFRGGQWWGRNRMASGGATVRFTFGQAGDIAVCGDWDGNGKDGPGVVRGRQWLLRNRASGGPPGYDFAYGGADGTPVVGDWDGDRRDGPGRVYGGRWALRNSPQAKPPRYRFRMGSGNDRFVVGDWDGDRRDEPGTVRGSSWRYRRDFSGTSPDLKVRFGKRGAVIVGKWDGLALDKPGRVQSGRWRLARFALRP